MTGVVVDVLAAEGSATVATDEPTGKRRRIPWTKLPPMSWAEFVEWLDLDNPATEKACGGYVPGTFKGTRRTRDNVIARSVVTLDADGSRARVPLEAIVDTLEIVHGWAAVVHTTFKATVEEPRARVLVPLSRPATAQEYGRVARWLMGQLCGVPGVWDDGGTQAERFMYRPAARDRTAYRSWVLTGKPLDVDAVLAEIGQTEPGEAEVAESVVDDDPDRDPTATEVEKARAVLEKAAGAVAHACDRNGEIVGRNAACLSWLIPLMSFVKVGALDRDDVEARLWEAVSRAPGDHRFPRAEFEHVVENACAIARPEWPRVDTPAEDFAERLSDLLDGDAETGASLWDERSFLAHIRAFALSRMVAPTALLGAVLLRVADQIPPNVVIPPVIGGEASLNLFAAIVGPSGAGKGAAVAAADAAFVWPSGVVRYPLGSGEGIAHAYAHREGRGASSVVVIDRTAVMFEASEIDTVTATMSRRGATLDSVLRSVWSGETLGAMNADVTRRLPIPALSYRATLVVGVQPERAGALFASEQGGTPQRFLWLPATSSEITADPDPEPEPWALPLPLWPMDRVRVGLPEVAVRTIREAHVARNRGEGEGLDGHALLTRTKVAVVLAVAEGRLDVTVDDWRLAGRVMGVSDATREEIRRTLATAAEREDVSRGRREGRRAAAADDERATRLEAAARDAVIDRLRKAGSSGMTRGSLNRSINPRHRPMLDDVVDSLKESRFLRVVDERLCWVGGKG